MTQHTHSTLPPRATGFTLIEILIAVAIMVILTTIGLVSYRQVGIGARDGKRKADLESVRQALVFYRTDEGMYPDIANADISGDCSGGSDARSGFEEMLGELSSEGYVTVTGNGLKDPKDGIECYGYRYRSPDNGATFELCAKLESDATPTTHSDDYCANSP